MICSCLITTIPPPTVAGIFSSTRYSVDSSGNRIIRAEDVNFHTLWLYRFNRTLHEINLLDKSGDIKQHIFTYQIGNAFFTDNDSISVDALLSSDANGDGDYEVDIRFTRRQFNDFRGWFLYIKDRNFPSPDVLRIVRIVPVESVSVKPADGLSRPDLSLEDLILPPPPTTLPLGPPRRFIWTWGPHSGYTIVGEFVTRHVDGVFINENGVIEHTFKAYHNGERVGMVVLLRIDPDTRKVSRHIFHDFYYRVGADHFESVNPQPKDLGFPVHLEDSTQWGGLASSNNYWSLGGSRGESLALVEGVAPTISPAPTPVRVRYFRWRFSGTRASNGATATYTAIGQFRVTTAVDTIIQDQVDNHVFRVYRGADENAPLEYTINFDGTDGPSFQAGAASAKVTLLDSDHAPSYQFNYTVGDAYFTSPSDGIFLKVNHPGTRLDSYEPGLAYIKVADQWALTIPAISGNRINGAISVTGEGGIGAVRITEVLGPEPLIPVITPSGG